LGVWGRREEQSFETQRAQRTQRRKAGEEGEEIFWGREEKRKPARGLVGEFGSGVVELI